MHHRYLLVHPRTGGIRYWPTRLVKDGKVALRHRGLVPIRVALCLMAVVGCGRTTLDPSVSVEGSGGSGGRVGDVSGGLGGSLQPTSGMHTAADAVGAGG